MKSSKNKEFYISLEGINLTEEQIIKIEKGIHELVLKELSKLNTTPDNTLLLTKFPRFRHDGVSMGMWVPNKDSILRIK